MNKKDIQAIYPLSDNQHAMLFHRLRNNTADPGFLQVHFALQGEIDASAFEAAWQNTIDHHEALRMSVHQPQGKPPVLIVRKAAILPWNWTDLRNSEAETHAQEIIVFCKRDQAQGIDLSISPAMRMAGFRTASQAYQFVWTCHHLLLDGWSSILAIQETMQRYVAIRNGEQSASQTTCGPFRDYFRWTTSRDSKESRQFWHNYLEGYVESTSIRALGSPQSGAAEHSPPTFTRLTVPPNLGQTIDKTATLAKVTPATIVSTIWAIWLSVVTQSNDVVFGNSVSGRSTQLPHAESVLGFLANVIPRRFTVKESDTLNDLFQRVHQDSFTSQPFQHTPLPQIHDASPLNASQSLFETLLVFENLPWRETTYRIDGDILLGGYSAGTTTTHPLTLTIKPGATWELEYHCGSQLSQQAINNVMSLLPKLLTIACDDPSANVAALTQQFRAQLPSTMLNTVSDNIVTPAANQAGVDSPKQLASSNTELKLAAIWENLLGCEEIDIHAGFLELGGRSIAAVRMLAMIEAEFGRRITLTELIERPTIAHLAALLEDSQSLTTTWRSLVPIRAQGTDPPVFFIHAGGGHVLFLRSLTNHLPKHYPLMGLQPVGLDGECEPMTSFEEIAAHYIRELQVMQPSGPYFFVGHCLGAKVAYEMVRQLKADGETIAMFVALDTQPPRATKVASRGVRAQQTAGQILEHLQSLRLGKALGVARQFMADKVEALGIRASQFYKRQWLMRYGSLERKKTLHLEFVESACVTAFRRYSAIPTDQKITLLASKEAEDCHQGWEAFTSDFHRIELPIGHYTMFTEPDVKVLCKAIDRLVAEAHQLNRDISRNVSLEASSSS